MALVSQFQAEISKISVHLSDLVVPHMIEWFAANKLVLNLGKQ